MNRDDVIALMDKWKRQRTIAFAEIEKSLDVLLQELGEGKSDDPFKNLNDTLIRDLSLQFKALKMPLINTFI